MNLPNSHFLDFPIEFKEINPEDFYLEAELNKNIEKYKGFKVDRKIKIKTDKEGYIYKKLQRHLALDVKNTVVINASVGSGKSYAIIQTIKKYYKASDKYLIVVATPFVSLVEQYVNDIHKDARIPIDQIYNYTDLGRNPSVTYLNKKVQVLTVNTLLGNPGEDSFKNSDVKRKYINDLIEYCKKSDTKVIFIYDEIHDAIQNFKEEFIFNLWKWKDVIAKNFVISATFSEASKVVIEYLAELTDKKIQIIETERIRIPKKQSELHLHYSSEYNFTNTTNEIVDVVEDLLNRDKKIDILCYSKSLAKSIIKDKQGIGKKLKNRFTKLNDCTSELVSNQRTKNKAPKNRYKNELCNIGTNFKTGVSIKKNNHAFVIIMPPRATRMWFRNKYGIFSDGINSIIQALARQRVKGEIHIILPKPDKFDMTSLNNIRMTEEQKNAFSKAYVKIQHYEVNEPVRYFPLNLQSFFIQDFYTRILEQNVIGEIEHLNNLERKGLTRLQFPSFKLFQLNRSEEYIANSFKFFGEDISAYITYCAFTNQFVNCNLVKINYKTVLFFKENEIQKNLNYCLNEYFGEDYYHSLLNHSNFYMAYSNFRNSIFSAFTLKYKKSTNVKWTKISPYNNKSFEIQLLRFVALKYFRNNYYYRIPVQLRLKDIEYTRSNYILDCISIADNINIGEVNYSEGNKNKVRLYQIISSFRTKLIANIQSHSSINTSFSYLANKPPVGLFDETDVSLFQEFLSLIEFDELLNNGVYEFKRISSITSFYSKLVEDFFEYENARLPIGRRANIKKIISIKPLPIATKVINLIEPAQYENIEPDENWIIQNYGSLENYENIQSITFNILKEHLNNQE